MLREEGSSPFVKVMDQQEKQESHDSPTPLLPRLDRLDRLLQLLEDKHNLSSGRQFCKISDNYDELKEKDEDQLLKKTLASALEEVQHKGTLMERLATLETRVLQLSLAIDEGNTSKSSSSTVELKDKQEDTKVVDGLGRKSPLGVQHSVTELRKKYERFVGSREWHNTRYRHDNTSSTKWRKTKQEGAQKVATVV